MTSIVASKAKVACDFCHEKKIRCDKPDGGACLNCRNTNKSCTFTKIPPLTLKKPSNRGSGASNRLVAPSPSNNVATNTRSSSSGSNAAPSWNDFHHQLKLFENKQQEQLDDLEDDYVKNLKTLEREKKEFISEASRFKAQLSDAENNIRASNVQLEKSQSELELEKEEHEKLKSLSFNRQDQADKEINRLKSEMAGLQNKLEVEEKVNSELLVEKTALLKENFTLSEEIKERNGKIKELEADFSFLEESEKKTAELSKELAKIEESSRAIRNKRKRSTINGEDTDSVGKPVIEREDGAADEGPSKSQKI